MGFKSISSGSRGNCALVWDDSDLLIVDFGISYRRFRLSTESFLQDSLSTSVFVSHEHSDHSSGLRTLKNKQSVDIYTKRRTGERLGIEFYPIERETTIGNFTVIPVAVSHDAIDPVVYVIRHGGTKISIVSDLGVATESLANAISDSDILAVEANHDVPMLNGGSYDPRLKRRILGEMGHLSNEQSAELLSRSTGGDSRIVLIHLSENNNHPDIALSHISSYLDNRKVSYRTIECATQDSGSSLYSI